MEQPIKNTIHQCEWCMAFFFEKIATKKKRAMGIPQNRRDWVDSFSKFPTVLLAPASALAPAAKRLKEKEGIFFLPPLYSSGKKYHCLVPVQSYVGSGYTRQFVAYIYLQ